MTSDLDKYGQQDRAYRFPYHHIPYFDRKTGAAVTTRSLGWGLEYLCYTRHIVEMCRSLSPGSVLDVGCGDGRFLGLLGAEVERRVGVDPSQRAIRFARAFHPEIEFRQASAEVLSERFEVVVAIEVLEHIPPGGATDFLRALTDRVGEDGHLIVSVPTPAARVLSKHHAHYDLETLEHRVADAGGQLRLLRGDYVFRRRYPLMVETALKLVQNRWWTFDLYCLRRPLWQYIWKYRLAPSGEGRHLVALFQKNQHTVSDRSGPATASSE